MPATKPVPRIYERCEPIINLRMGMPDWPLAQWGERIVFVMGNCPQKNDNLWSACWISGERCDPPCWDLIPLPHTDQPTMGVVVERVASWARLGNAHAAFWLGYWYEDTHPVSAFWYYLASMRQHRGYRELFDRVCCDLYGAVRAHLAKERSAGVHELTTGQFSLDWQSAIASAEAACTSKGR